MTESSRGEFDSQRAPQVEYKTVQCRPAQESLLRRLGAALVVQWDALPDELQDLLIDQAAVVEDREEAPHTIGDIENFIRGAKVASIAKSALESDKGAT